MMKLIVLLSFLVCAASGFHVAPMTSTANVRMWSSSTKGDDEAPLPFFAEFEDEAAPKKSLEAKMAGWEATDGKAKAAVPEERAQGFNAGLYVAFPFMIIGSLLFAFFPLIMDKIDVSSVGPPPTI